ncbi:hypothetical protein LINPERPRIM_LOCUS40881, partial [Linum perenne]
MRYAGVIRRNSLPDLVQYNWCGHVLKHMREGFVMARIRKYLNVDIHLIMVCILQKFGSNASSPEPTIPFCGMWDTT